MQHHLRIPRRPLADYVESLWLVRGHLALAQRQLLLPDAATVLMFNLGEPQKLCDRADPRRHTVYRASWISGQPPQPIVIEQAGAYHLIGVRFRPGGAFPLLRVALSELTGRVLELDDLWGAHAGRVREQLADALDDTTRLARLEAWLAFRLRTAGPADARICHAAARLQRGGATVAGVAQEVGLSPKHLVHEFSHRVGLTPKHFARIHRFQRAILEIGTRARVDWSALAFAQGYCDQAHLIREFGEIAGMTPGELLARRTLFPGYLEAA